MRPQDRHSEAFARVTKAARIMAIDLEPPRNPPHITRLYEIHGDLVQRMFMDDRPHPWLRLRLWWVRWRLHRWQAAQDRAARGHRPLSPRCVDVLVAALIAGACTAVVGWWAGVMWL